MLRLIFLLLALLMTSVAAVNATDASAYAPKSALAEGRWVKISISESGFYKLTYSDLKKMGFANPEKVSVHGYGGWPLDEAFSNGGYVDDVPAVPVWRGTDYLLFYGKGTVKWTYNGIDKTFTHENNAYATKGYYFVTDATDAKEVATATGDNSAGGVQTIDTYDDYMLHEMDKVSLTNPGRPNSGRELFGESFDAGGTQSFTFNIPGVTADDGLIDFRFVAKIKSGTGTVTMNVFDSEVTASGKLYQNTNIYTAATSVQPAVKWTGAKSEKTDVYISFDMSGQTANLDYIRLQMKRVLQPYGACTFFRSIQSENAAAKFVIKNASADLLVFDVTDEDIKLVETTLSGTEATFTIPAQALREFAVVDKSQKLPTPETIGVIEPQNLHGMEQQDMIILTPEAFVAEAERLAQVHRLRDNLKVAIVTPEKVYNEFSSGGQEATAIRRFMKMFYDRSKAADGDGTNAPKHLLLMGDGRWDNRKLSDVWKNSSDNYLPTYQSHESIAENSYTSDDYFAFLDDEGANPVSATMRIGVGRFPVNTLAQARNAVDKVIGYIESSRSGAWKNKLGFVADDGNNNDSDARIHMRDIDSLARYVENHHPEFLSKKLYFDAHKISYTGGKPTYPSIRTGLQKELKEGLLILNYVGHSDAVSWAEEKVMTQSDINNFTYRNLPLWITSSCDFTCFDAPTNSAGEDVFLNPKSGGIALYTTSRVAYSDPNAVIHKLFIRELLEKNEDGRHKTLGEAMMNAKNDYKVEQIMTFVLIGDPAMRLAYPDDFAMEITEINGQAVSETPANFRALEKITVSGQVSRHEGGRIDDFNGLLSTTVFDSQSTIQTLNNANIGEFSYTDYPNVIYMGNATVQNGRFDFTFMLPKDISYSNEKGKISLYAVDETNGIEANGAYKNFTVGGTADTEISDADGPEIRAIYLNTTDFTDGGEVNPTPVFAAVVWDESGVNTGGSSIGHDITLTINDNPNMIYSLNSYYETYLAGNSGEGIVRFPVPQLEAGKYKAEFKIWDILNNSSTQAFNFVVKDNYRADILNLTAGPSPAVDYATFMITHDMPESLITVEIEVMDLSGRLQWKHTETGSSEMFDSYTVKWNLTNGAGARLRPGVYVYRATVRTGKTTEVSKSNKIIVMAQ
ncbi:MAG: type IX secretion system sortase PorU [Tannerella sp.]|jgi:hypothetical protein|nr:type IX secretion system sortase PorU [Tannerella sp.]